jgi:hypothetical protein
MAYLIRVIKLDKQRDHPIRFFFEKDTTKFTTQSPFLKRPIEGFEWMDERRG